MATYKLIQDIEAEDHILGPLTLRQFIYGLVAVFFYYICFIVITKHVIFFLPVFLPVALFATLFAFPFKRDQPTEVWVLAKLRYILKPKRRIWSQSGIKEMVTITAPKKIEKPLTNGLSQAEVESRLQALTLTIDSRGWAVKNLQEAPQGARQEDNSDRLVGVGSIMKPVLEYGPAPEEDMLDDQSPQSQLAEELINQKGREFRKELLDSMNAARNVRVQEPVLPPPIDEAELSSVLKSRSYTSSLSTSNLHGIATEPKKPQSQTVKTIPKPNPAHLSPDKLNFALNNSSNLSVQTQATEAQKTSDEVVINLH